LITIRPTLRPSAAVSDHELMRRIQADDVRAFEALYDRYSARAFGLARVICGGSRRAEEAVQDGFLSLWRSRASYDPARGNPGAWLLTVIRYRSIDVMRRGGQDDRLRESDGQLDYLPALGSVAKDAEAHDEATRLRASLHALPAAQLEVIALAYFGGLTHTEIAARLQLPAGTVKGRMRLGVQKLRDEIASSPQQLSPQN
jgi:RNA polymerase sigma-70 factor (ECF subfamily)